MRNKFINWKPKIIRVVAEIGKVGRGVWSVLGRLKRVKFFSILRHIIHTNYPFIKHTLSTLFLFEHNINYLSHLNQEADKYQKYKICKVPFVPFNVRVEFYITVKTNLNKKPINSIQTFKSDECVICLTNQPIISFCNCDHIPICTECYKLKSLSACPVCKTENTILRVIE